jgi:hypothetical protein
MKIKVRRTMTTNDDMTIDEMYKYLRKIQPLYQKADRKRKGHYLDEMESVTGRNRDYLIHILKGPLKRRKRQRQRTRTYKADFDRILRVIYESYDDICAERLQPNLLQLAEQLASHGEVTLTEKLRTQLATVSLSTVRNRLRQYRQDEPWTPRRPPRSPNPFLQDIPMRRLPWDIDMPGYFEVDLVHHCGSSVQGEYVHTLQMIDVFSGWSERVALLGRSFRVVKAGFQRILDRLPFPIHGVHPDNGSEFFNSHMLNFWSNHPQVHLSRSRPYHKNDNRFVEQKNSSLVRAYVGDIRLATVAQTQALENIYHHLWLFNNCFQPSLRLFSKQSIPADAYHPARIRRRYSARTPWQRICAAKVLGDDVHDMLQLRINLTNPSVLRRQIYADLDALYSLPAKSSPEPENVFVTLNQSKSLP